MHHHPHHHQHSITLYTLHTLINPTSQTPTTPPNQTQRNASTRWSITSTTNFSTYLHSPPSLSFPFLSFPPGGACFQVPQRMANPVKIGRGSAEKCETKIRNRREGVRRVCEEIEWGCIRGAGDSGDGGGVCWGKRKNSKQARRERKGRKGGWWRAMTGVLPRHAYYSSIIH